MAINPRNFASCVAKIAAAGRITSGQATDLLQLVADRAERMRRTGQGDAAVTAAAKLASDVKAAAKVMRLDALKNAASRARLRTAVADNGGAANAFKTLRSFMHFEYGADRNDSAESLWHGLGRSWIGAMGNKIRTGGFQKAAQSGLLDNQIAEALWRKSDGTPDVAVKISPAAQAIADAFTPPLEEARNRLNSVGADIKEAHYHVSHTNWDARALRRAAGPQGSPEMAFEAWWARERPRMADYTFKEVEPKEGQSQADAEKEFGKSVFYGRLTGVDLDTGGIEGLGMAEGNPAEAEADYIPKAYEGTRNIAKSLSQHRMIFWKDSKSWVEHMREFGGGGSLYAQVVHTLDSSARHYALMSKFGTNPAGNLNQVIEDTLKTYRDSQPDQVRKFATLVPQLQNTMGRLDGSLNAPINADRQRMVESALTLEATMHLGGVSITHLTAAPFTLSSELAHHGISHWEAIGKIVKAIFTPAAKGDQRAIMAEAGGYTHGLHASLGAAMQRPDTGLPGYVSWRAAQFMQLTGLPYFIDKLQADGMKGMLMANLGHQSEKAFADLEPHVQAMLGHYGISQAGWDLLRNAEDPVTVNGVRYVTPGDVNRIPDATMTAHLREAGVLPAEDEAFAKLTPEQTAASVAKARWQLGDRLLMYLNDASERATVTPGVRERGLILGDARPGSWNYIFRRFGMQFKMWPLAAYHQLFLNNLSASLSRSEAAQNIGWILALSTAGGALRMSINDAVNGRPQRNYLEPVTALQAFAQGGGLGIYGDFLTGEISRMGSGFVSTVGGPVVGDADRLLRIYGRFLSDVQTGQGGKALNHAWPDLVHFGIGHIPFGNLIYLKGALDYLLWYRAYEAISPGWWERTNRRMIKEQGRGMVGYTPGGKIPYTPFGAMLQ
jgi:hypothetical protein